MILNPTVGDFNDSDISSLLEIMNDSIIPAVIINERAEETLYNIEHKKV